MSFLAGVAAELVKWLLTKLADFGKTLVERMLRKKKAEEESKESVEPLKKAQTEDEINTAADDALGKF